MAIQVPTELLDGSVLGLLTQQDYYGYTLTQEVRQLLPISESTLYPVLRRLKKNGWLETYDEPFQGRNRRYYKLTASGRTRLKEIQGDWQNFSQAIAQLLRETRMNDYIKEVERLIGQLTTGEQQDVVEYYREYLLDAGIETYQQAVDELGTPRSLARKVLADYSIRLSEQSQQASGPSRTAAQAAKGNVKTVWLIILALLSTPVTIPILIVVVALLFAMVAVLGSLIVAAFAIFLSIMALGVVVVVIGLWVIWQTPWTGLFYLGMGLLALGGSLLAWLILKWIGSKVVWALSWAAQGIYRRFIPRSRAERGRKL